MVGGEWRVASGGRSIPTAATHTAVAAHTPQFDADYSGTLDVPEIKSFLKKLQDAADAAAKEMVHAVKQVQSLQRKSKQREEELIKAEAELQAANLARERERDRMVAEEAVDVAVKSLDKDKGARRRSVGA